MKAGIHPAYNEVNVSLRVRIDSLHTRSTHKGDLTRRNLLELPSRSLLDGKSW